VLFICTQSSTYLSVPFILFQGHHHDVIRFHYWIRNGRNTFKEILRVILRAAWKRSNEVYEIIWTLGALIDALEAQRHFAELVCSYMGEQ
jgi:hypothetical protein